MVKRNIHWTKPLHLHFHTEAISIETCHPASLNDIFLITESYNHWAKACGWWILIKVLYLFQESELIFRELIQFMTPRCFSLANNVFVMSLSFFCFFFALRGCLFRYRSCWKLSDVMVSYISTRDRICLGLSHE